MNKQKLNEPAAHKEDGVEKRRRFIKSAAFAAPVVLTLSSPSVFGDSGFCLSQVMSGNASNVTGSCTLGQNPSYWKNPANKSAWATAGFNYGISAIINDQFCANYSGGTNFNDNSAFLGSGVSSTMESLLCSSPNTVNAYLVAALLNASTPNSNYIYTADQVRQLQAKTLGVPPQNSTADGVVLNFLISTMYP